MKIRDNELYKLKNGGEYRTFEQYCKGVWDFQRAHVYRLIDSAKVVEVLSPIGIQKPENERQTRPLSKLEPERQREVWQKAVETAPNGKVTAYINYRSYQMPAKPRKRRERKTSSVPAALKYFFETGTENQDLFPEDERFNPFLIFDCGEGLRLKDCWEISKKELLSKWIQLFPCRRPWAWWKFESKEPRKRISGPKPDYEIWGVAPSCNFGIPSQWILYQMDFNSGKIDPNDPPIYESEAAYLQRLDLLTPSEERWLAEHQELLSPVEVEVISN